MDLLDRPAHELASLVAKGEVAAVELARASLERIASNRALGAFLTVGEEQALRAARAVDEKRSKGERLGKLAGVPIAIKDALATQDAPTTAASRILLRTIGDPPNPADGYVPPYDATAVARLRAADAVIVGKTNMDEFAMGSSTENSAFGVAKNPHDPTRTPGGSSGGSAVAVAAKMTPLALGSDTGGSIRQPAALTGVVGVKPTYGRVSRYGLFAFASSLDQIGVFAGDVRSAAIALETIAGPDEHDATCAAGQVPGLDPATMLSDPFRRDGRPLRVGVPRETLDEGVAPGVQRAVRATLETLAKAGAEIVEVSLPSTRFAVATYYVIATAEASSNLARYDGIRYGLRVHDRGDPLGALYKKTRGSGFGKEVKRRIILGTFVLSSGYYEAYYLRAQRVRALIHAELEQALAKVDVLASPTSPTVAFELGERTEDPISMYLADVCTLPASLAGLPALSMPCGFAQPDGGGVELPVGLQLVAPAFAEPALFHVAHGVESLLSPGRCMIIARAVRPADAPRLRELFEASNNVCFCRWLHFEGDKNEWLLRCAEASDENREELERAVSSEREDGLGAVAFEDDALVGWMKLAPARAVKKAYDQRFYRSLPCFAENRAGAYLIGCALVHPEHRRRGVATALVGAAIDVAKKRGGAIVEALPRMPRGERERDEELWTVPVAALTAHGFEVVGGEAPYPVMRLELG